MFAYQDPPDHQSRTVYLDAEELQLLTHYWAARLGLQAWRIDVNVTRAVDMPSQTAQGSARITHSRRMAEVHLLDPRDHRPGVHLDYDMETTLVHELLHVVFGPWGRESDNGPGSMSERSVVLYETCIEHPVEQLSIALVALRRATETKKNRLGVWR